MLWVPALAGATAPEWNADARAGWFGLTAAHGRAHLARALLEGNAFALRDVLEAIQAAGQRTVELSASRAARAAIYCGRSARTSPACPSPGRTTSRPTARGAAMLAAVGAGLHADVHSASRAMAGPRSEPLLPRPEFGEVYDALYRRHRELYAALRPLFS